MSDYIEEQREKVRRRLEADRLADFARIRREEERATREAEERTGKAEASNLLLPRFFEWASEIELPEVVGITVSDDAALRCVPIDIWTLKLDDYSDPLNIARQHTISS